MSRAPERGGGAGSRHAAGSGRSTLRCAIYTRKSTDEGLEQEFNSLDAQREACEAYTLSQRHEGWSLSPESYDDGGYSGGNMDRPALQQLLADVEAGKVDVIVVYKVDRLTRSLADFAKIVEILDAAGASFVSVTQAFNTTTSMGRLTLNVLLSFAQFEREVTSERIRDKIAASKAKGMWMGGPVPLGYIVRDRKLVVCDEEAASVRLIFERYIALGSTNLLLDELHRRGIRTKQKQLADGRVSGGVAFTKGGLAHLLQNPVYVGEVRHKDQCFPGEHSAILERELWDKARSILDANRRDHVLGTRAEHPSLLAGMLFDEQGRGLTPTHTVKGSRRYRYYVSRIEAGDRTRPTRLPAGEIEQLVRDRIGGFLRDTGTIGIRLKHFVTGDVLHELTDHCREIGEELAGRAVTRQREMLILLQMNVRVQADRVVLLLCIDRLVELSGEAEQIPPFEIEVPVVLASRGRELRLVFQPDDRDAPIRRDDKLVNLIAKAFAAKSRLEEIRGLDELSSTGVAHLTRLARLSFLAPDIIASILDGRQPPTLSSRELLRASHLPVCWHGQRRKLRFG
jgi:DNA invertase Pin-like site-specific DNA recombinase